MYVAGLLVIYVPASCPGYTDVFQWPRSHASGHNPSLSKINPRLVSLCHDRVPPFLPVDLRPTHMSTGAALLLPPLPEPPILRAGRGRTVGALEPAERREDLWREEDERGRINSVQRGRCWFALSVQTISAELIYAPRESFYICETIKDQRALWGPSVTQLARVSARAR